MTSDFIVATNLKTLVGLYGLTYKRLADELNMEQSVVFRIVKGQRKVSLKLLDKLAEVFNCNPKDLLDPEFALGVGWQLMFNKDFKVILGRNAEENESLTRYAHPDDHLMTFTELQGPTLLLKGYNPSADILSTAAGLIQQFSKYKSDAPQRMTYWAICEPNNTNDLVAQKLSKDHIDKMYI